MHPKEGILCAFPQNMNPKQENLTPKFDRTMKKVLLFPKRLIVTT